MVSTGYLHKGGSTYNCGHYGGGRGFGCLQWGLGLAVRTVQKVGRTVDHLYSFILDGPRSLDGPSGPLGALSRICYAYFYPCRVLVYPCRAVCPMLRTPIWVRFWAGCLVALMPSPSRFGGLPKGPQPDAGARLRSPNPNPPRNLVTVYPLQSRYTFPPELIGSSTRQWLYVPFAKAFPQISLAPYPPTSSVPVIDCFTIVIIHRQLFVSQLPKAVQCARFWHVKWTTIGSLRRWKIKNGSRWSEESLIPNNHLASGSDSTIFLINNCLFLLPPKYRKLSNCHVYELSVAC